ncbi:NUDIX domain-containing protein [Streptomyces goshikiensis]|uniref:NUDIX domain-containing protein n=1 Tax=Streptomyces goshikiensis TaxID=1942 RepID=UPI00368B994A
MIDGWSTIPSTVPCSGVRVVVRRDTVRRSDQSEGTYEYIESGDGVRVVALDARGRIALVAENVYVCGQRLLMCPGGGCEPGEGPQTAARRELAEEAGIRATDVELLTTMWRMPAGARTREHLYLARGLTVGEHDRDASEADMELRRPDCRSRHPRGCPTHSTARRCPTQAVTPRATDARLAGAAA